jgi:1-deoxy-D-xylulose-5-phosphate reductoisomerase
MTSEPRRLVLLGSTGSIGTQTLDVVDRLRKRGHVFEVSALAAGRNLDRLCEQIEAHRPRAVCIASADDARTLSARYPKLEVVSGDEGLRHLARLAECDLVVNALVGAVGLAPTLAALELGRPVALANKESLVVGGDLVRRALSEHNGRLLPIDSEHNALFQCLEAGTREEIERLILTASGGPFLRTPPEQLAEVTPAEALDHPNWTMGSRITIDSATMVNKAFEVIEAHHLFDVPYDRIDVVVHPESTIHSLVEYRDGSILAELAAPDMRIPIQYALIYPERAASGLSRLPLSSAFSLHLEPIEPARFPAFGVVLEAARHRGTATAAINAADEVLVSRFLHGEIPFPGIAAGLREILDRWNAEIADGGSVPTLERTHEVDAWARDAASGLSRG